MAPGSCFFARLGLTVVCAFIEYGLEQETVGRRQVLVLMGSLDSVSS